MTAQARAQLAALDALTAQLDTRTTAAAMRLRLVTRLAAQAVGARKP